ncbi:hypothetical protein [Streptomyces sp. ODS28]|uniref:hypothetical protein n=1 Tax=Streptomyces sp. ODS28 TaxID=3136688 RepID=UPI0031E7C429
MGQDKTLTRGARVLGAAATAVLAVCGLCWIVRDFVAADEVVDVWWTWSGMPPRATDGLWATSFVEPTLVILYAVCAVTVPRSSAAAGVLASTGVLTVLLRVPSLWNLNSDWMTVVDSTTKSWALATVITTVVLGAVLVLTAALGRRPVAGGGAVPYYAWEDDTPPALPTRRGGPLAALLLGATAAGLLAWEAHAALDQGWALYRRALTGEDVLVGLLSVPGSWAAWTAALLSAAAAFAAAGRASFARPLGMAVSALLAGLGVFYLSYAARMGLFHELGERSVQEQLRLALAVLEIGAAVGVLCALSPGERRQEAEGGDGGEGADEDGPPTLRRDYGPGTGPGYAPPPPANPPANW